MGTGKRIISLLTGIVMILGAVMMFIEPELTYLVIILVVDIILLYKGIQSVVYYFRMAKYMVDGLSIFFKGILMLDLGIFVFFLGAMPPVFVMLYLVVMLAVSGALFMAKGLESKGVGAKNWKRPFIDGVIRIILAVLCLFFLNSLEMMQIMISVTLVFSSLDRFVTAFKENAIVYVGV
ncbi:MAG: DUF308 domain-containing protein [Eubacterium sp.]|nr:DUF308 domain-containing protein [Eubacterium sp.]